MTRPASPRSRPLERGEITWVTLLLLLGLAAGGYLAVVWIPVAVVGYEVKQTVRDFMNQAVRDPDDERLVQRLAARVAALETREVVGADGQVTQLPAVEVQASDVTWERDTSRSPPTLHVVVPFRLLVVYPLLHRIEQRGYAVELSQDLAVPRWDGAR